MFPLVVGATLALPGSQPSEAIILVKSSAYEATAAPVPDGCSDCRASDASVCGARARFDGLRRKNVPLLPRQHVPCSLGTLLTCPGVCPMCKRSSVELAMVRFALCKPSRAHERQRQQRFKVVERAGGRRGHGRHGHDVRAQPRAAWARAWATEGAAASDSADDRRSSGRVFRFGRFGPN